MCEYHSKQWTERICWSCGYYESDSPAYRAYPELFRNMVKENPKIFMKEILKISTIRRNFTERKSDVNETEPNVGFRILYPFVKGISKNIRKFCFGDNWY